MSNIFDIFKLKDEQEEYEAVVTSISSGVAFRGTNLWILMFAIFVASLGLNVNSTAVVIGAMLISPLMGPILGLGLGTAIHDISLLKRAIYNYSAASLVALATSTLFFAVSPINEAHSEILARTSPNVYDVLIALFGGLAGTLATSSRQKGNVIPGVAIATALMPPLCTAGYGIATWQFSIFMGASYLYIINTVFIALATFLTVRVLKFPIMHMVDVKAEKRAQRLIWVIVVLTLIPSIYFGYDLVQQTRFMSRAETFVTNEAVFPDDYLLNKKIDPKTGTIRLTFGGRKITDEEIAALKGKLRAYGLGSAALEIRQGFAYLNENLNIKEEEQDRFTRLLKAKDFEVAALKSSLDSIREQQKLGAQIYSELKIQYPNLKTAVIEPSRIMTDSMIASEPVYFAFLNIGRRLPNVEKVKIENWLKTRLQVSDLKLVVTQD